MKMLFVSNTRDPITPIENGRAAREMFKDAGLLVGDATGHTSLVTGNECVQREIRGFFNGGWKERKDGLGEVRCELEVGPFGVLVNVSLEGRGEWVGVSVGKKRLL